MKLGKTPIKHQTRHRRKFAWWPTRCDDATRRWMEFLDIKEIYIVITGEGFWDIQEIKPWEGKK